MGAAATPITFDPYARTWRTLQPWEDANLVTTTPGATRGAHWPLTAKLSGVAARGLGRTYDLPVAAGTVVPEIFSTAIAAHLDRLPRPRVALFHDAIALKLPEFTPQKTVSRFPAYLRELLAFDGIAAVSDDSRDALLEYWRWLGVPQQPPVRTLALGIDTPGTSDDGARRASAGVAEPPTVLCVGSIEGRKNHLALLEACERLWGNGRTFTLQLIGIARAETARPALERLAALRAKGRPIRHEADADDAALDAAYAACAFTVYPSLMEGFGLPVLESLAHGKPCLCSNRGALGEAARGGGCLAIESVDAPALAGAIERLLLDESKRARLTREAKQRPLRTWRDYATDLTEWTRQLARDRSS